MLLILTLGLIVLMLGIIEQIFKLSMYMLIIVDFPDPLRPEIITELLFSRTPFSCIAFSICSNINIR